MVSVHCFYGAGGTGKSAVIEAMRGVLEKMGVEIMPSVTRGWYARAGVPDEAAFFALKAEERLSFQLGLLQHYSEELSLRVRGAWGKGSAGLLCDRSVFDHVAHCVFSNPETLGMGVWQVRVVPLIKRFMELNPTLYYFPYPPAWLSAEGMDVGADGFRHRVFGKDLCLDALMTSLVARASARSYTVPSDMDVETRAGLVRGFMSKSQ